MDWSELFGWLGTAAIFAAYFFHNIGAISSSGKIYHFLNLAGALGIVAVSYAKSAYQPAFLNVGWALVAIAGILRPAGR